MEQKLENEIDVWLEQTKRELLLNVDVAIGKNVVDRSTLETMKNLIETMRATSRKTGG